MRQVLPVIGAAIGAYFGGAQGAQIGWAIGSYVGNAVDPLVIKGPSIGDLTQQTSQEGTPRPIFFALSQPVSGNIVMCSQPKIVKKKESSGKGGGPVTEVQTVFRSYAVAIGEGPNVQLIRCWSNGKLVYDVRPGQVINNAPFLATGVFHNGDYDQMPDSHMQAVFGVANTPAMRGTCYVAFHDVDLTSFSGAVPQYIFQVMRCEGQYLTSRPYALELESDMAPNAVPTRIRLEPQPTLGSPMTAPATLVSVELFGGSETYSYDPPEDMTMDADLVSVELFGGAKSYNYTPPEKLTVGADIVSVELFGGAVTYAIGNRDVNNMQVSADLVSITLE